MLKQFKLIFHLYLFLIKLISGHIIEHVALKNHELLAESVLYVTEKYISSQTNTVVVLQMCKICGSSQQKFHYHLLDYVLLNFTSSSTRLLYVDEKDNQPWNYNIFIVDSAEAFNDQIKHIPFNTYETDFHFLVVLTQANNLQTNMMAIILSALDIYVINLVIMVEEQKGQINFYRSEVFGTDCGDKVLVPQINTFNAGKLQYDFLFPYRMRSFDNCTLRVAVHDVPPIFIFNGDKKNESHLTDSKRISGIDGQVLRILAESMNFRLKLMFPAEKGEVFANGTATGCFSLLNNETAQAVIGSFGTQDNYRTYYTASMVYHQTPNIVVVRSGLQYSPVKQLMCPFESQLWNLMIWLVLISLTMVGYLRRCANDSINADRCAMFDLIVIMLGLPLKYLPQRNSARLFMVCWIFFTFMLRNLYQGKMFDSLRVARRIPLPRSLDELIRYGYYMVSREYYDFYPRNLTWIIDADYPMRFAMLENADDNLRIASNSLLDYLAHYNWLHWRTSRLTMINDPIYLFQFVIYYKKHSRFKFAFDAKLKQLMNAGIISHITNQYVKHKFWVMNEKNLEVPQIGNEMLYGLYAIYAGLAAFAIMIFALEVLSRKFRLLELFISKINSFQ